MKYILLYSSTSGLLALFVEQLPSRDTAMDIRLFVLCSGLVLCHSKCRTREGELATQNYLAQLRGGCCTMGGSAFVAGCRILTNWGELARGTERGGRAEPNGAYSD
jgi:hypothetical protein